MDSQSHENSAHALLDICARNPHRSDLARANSHYLGCVDGRLTCLLDNSRPAPRDHEIEQALRAFISGGKHPCAGARAAIAAEGYRLGVYPAIGSANASAGLARDLWTFVAERPRIDAEFATLIAIFDGDNPVFKDDKPVSEKTFEVQVWRQLQALSDLDCDQYDDAASSDPARPDFGFSFAGRAFFIVGLHPGSSRLARRFRWPALAFNAHAQFDALQEAGIYDRFRASVRKRDLALQGSLNPNLAEFGESSEARQYSGRAVEKDWKCPFHRD
jgi:FPC/CPF motif-containing protein YcgG